MTKRARGKRRDGGRKMLALWVEKSTADGIGKWAGAAGMSEHEFVRVVLRAEVARLEGEEAGVNLCGGEGLM